MATSDEVDFDMAKDDEDERQSEGYVTDLDKNTLINQREKLQKKK